MVDKELENDDDYALAVDEVEKSELLAENEPLETSEETTTINEEKHETTPEEISINTITSESVTKKRNQELVKCETCGTFVTANTLEYTHMNFIYKFRFYICLLCHFNPSGRFIWKSRVVSIGQ